MFKVGDKIRCLNPGSNSLISNKIYTVSEISTSVFRNDMKMVGLEEIPFEGHYYIDRFELAEKAKVMPLERLPKWW